MDAKRDDAGRIVKETDDSGVKAPAPGQGSGQASGGQVPGAATSSPPAAGLEMAGAHERDEQAHRFSRPVGYYFPGTEGAGGGAGKPGPYPCLVTHTYADGSADLMVANNPAWPLAGPGGSTEHAAVMRSRVLRGTPGKSEGEFWSPDPV